MSTVATSRLGDSSIKLVQANSMAPQAWRNGGGQTRELLAWPNASDWQLRISRADIEADGPFSAFAGVQRWFVVLTGNGVVLQMPTADGHTLDHPLLPGHAPLHFDGGLAPGCQLISGPTQDLNLMARGGHACMLPVEADTSWLPGYAMCGVYTTVSGSWTDGHQTLHLSAHTLLWLERAPRTAMHFVADATDATDETEAANVAKPAPAYWLGFTPQATA